MVSKRCIALLYSSLIFLAVSCAKEKTSTVSEANLKSKLIFVHAASDVSKVDFYLDTYRQNRFPVLYGSVLGYFGAREGSQSYVVRIPITNFPLLNGQLSIAQRANYTMVFTGLSSSDLYPLKAFLIADSAQNLPSLGKAKIRLVNASPNEQKFDVYANNTLAFGASPYLQITDYLELPAGTWNFKVNLTKNATITKDSTVASALEVILQDGKSYTLFTRGIPGRTDSTAMAAFVIPGVKLTP